MHCIILKSKDVWIYTRVMLSVSAFVSQVIFIYLSGDTNYLQK